MKRTLIFLFTLTVLSIGCLEDNDLGEPPEATLSVTQYEGPAPFTVGFTVTLKESGYTVNRFEWDFDGDGITDETTPANQPSANYTFKTKGTYRPYISVFFNENEASSYAFLWTNDHNGEIKVTE